MLIDNRKLIEDNDLTEVTGAGDMNMDTNTEKRLPISAGLKNIMDLMEYYTPAYDIGNNQLYSSKEEKL